MEIPEPPSQLQDSSQARESPFDKLPNEIIALIFTSIWETLSTEEKFFFPLSYPQLVSRRWREITLSTPQLWTTLYVDKRASSFLLLNYLTRSGNMPLDLKILHLDSYSLLVPYASRWGSLSLWLDPYDPLGSLLSLIPSNSISLRHFSLLVSGLPNEEDWMIGDRIAFLAHNLTTLRLIHVSVDWKRIPRTWTNLTEMVLVRYGPDVNAEGTDIASFVEALDACPKLRTLRLFNLVFQKDAIIPRICTSSSGTSGGIVLPELHELVLGEFYPFEIVFLLFEIECPRLHQLGLEAVAYVDDFQPDIDWDRFTNRYPHLQQFDLWTANYAFDGLLPLLRALPPIRILGIRGGNLYVSDDKSIDFDILEDVFESLGHLRSSVRTIWTRMVDVMSLKLFYNVWFPETETIYMHWEDVAVIETEPGVETIVDDLDGLPQIVFWGRESDQSWYLESTFERLNRVESTKRGGIYSLTS